ncbi:cytochrome c [Bartonella sp. HY406]|uniref:cytochrome c n=1 Tax=Bartonella sp. HY406 TaxID=2979331 RepID=UPI0021C8F66C|nr:cytochrome c [Bartonella sp. HY406]UXN02932.1 cytochrome c [Bartonella sp. HY406]
MRRFMKIILSLIILGLVAIAGIIFIPIQRTGPLENLPTDYKPAKGAGEYVAMLADCAACHTAPNGKAFAGGREVESPFGTIYSSNITPSKEGIGNWTLDQFRDAVRDGIAADGSHLYPAMPYENYRKISEKDMVALYDYFMHEVKAVDEATPKTSLMFPFNQRWGIRVWNWYALQGDAGFNNRYKNEQLDRGAYIVESLAHCSACHTPRDLFFRQESTDATGKNFLAGANLSGWYAPDLSSNHSTMQGWSDEDIALYLTTARNNISAAVGPMQLVAGESLQFASKDDVNAIVAYLRHIKQDRPVVKSASAAIIDTQKTTKLLTDAAPDMPLGARLYLDNCNACHFANGRGAPQVFPQLDGASIVNAKDPSGMIDVILHGARLPSTKQRPADLAMPSFAYRMNDEEVATLVTFLRHAWGNNAPKVDAKDVAKIRANPLKQ